MKQPRGQCTFKDSRTRARCTSQAWKAGERLCIDHNVTKALKTAALDKVLKHHTRHCTFWVFSGDRHCSCGRDAAINELDRICELLRAVVNITGPNKT